MSSTTVLDADELFHLAIRASNEENHENAIRYLKQSLILEPENAKAQYLLAAEHAEIGMFERAIVEMQRAVAVEPTLWTAHFQLGLMQLVQNQPEASLSSWQALDTLDKNDPLFLFKTGLTHLIHEQPQQAADYLNQGIENNQMNPALNNDMQRILDNISPLLDTAETHESAQSNPEQNVVEEIDGTAANDAGNLTEATLETNKPLEEKDKSGKSDTPATSDELNVNNDGIPEEEKRSQAVNKLFLSLYDTDEKH